MHSNITAPIGIDKIRDKEIFIHFTEGFIYYVQNGKYILRKSTGSEIRSKSFRLCYEYYIGSHNRKRMYA